MNYKILGILGGMGPYAGSFFAQKLFELNQTACEDSAHLECVLYSNPTIPNRSNALLSGAPSPVNEIAISLNKLSTIGCCYGVIICNTAHIYIDEIVKKSRLPIINLIECAAINIAERGIKEVGLLATSATISYGLYDKYLGPLGIRVINPEKKHQTLLNNLIFNSSYGIKATAPTISDKALDDLHIVIDAMQERGVQHLVLGCTELSLAMPSLKQSNIEFLDPIIYLADKCIALTALQRAKNSELVNMM